MAWRPEKMRKNERQFMRRYLQENLALIDPLRLLARPKNRRDWERLMAQSLRRWRAGEMPDFDKWREEIVDGLTRLDREMLAAISAVSDPERWNKDDCFDAYALACVLAAQARGVQLTQPIFATMAKLLVKFGLKTRVVTLPSGAKFEIPVEAAALT